MTEQNNTQQSMATEQTALQFGGPELMHVHEAMGALTGALEHIYMHEAHIQDKQLSSIVMTQKQFLTDIYNVIVETIQTANEPTMKIGVYSMQEKNPAPAFGFTPKAPAKPITQTSQLTDECISSAILGHLKGIVSTFSTTALEASQPVLRRVIADSVPQVTEMAYEIFLYENQKAYYEVPQYNTSDMLHIINHYVKI